MTARKRTKMRNKKTQRKSGGSKNDAEDARDAKVTWYRRRCRHKARYSPKKKNVGRVVCCEVKRGRQFVWENLGGKFVWEKRRGRESLFTMGAGRASDCGLRATQKRVGSVWEACVWPKWRNAAGTSPSLVALVKSLQSLQESKSLQSPVQSPVTPVAPASPSVPPKSQVPSPPIALPSPAQPEPGPARSQLPAPDTPARAGDQTCAQHTHAHTVHQSTHTHQP